MPTEQTPAAADRAPATQDKSRLETLLRKLDGLLKERYAFDVFAKDSINFGVLATYRQTWEPQRYQVGDLVSTIPLSPKEIRRYTTRQVDKKSRAVKEVEDNLRTQRTDSSDTARAESEIVEKAQKKSNFQLTADESFGNEGIYQVKAGQTVGGSQDKESQSTKRAFRESVLKSAQEYRQQHRMEVDTTTSAERRHLPVLRATAHLPAQRAPPPADAGHPRRQRGPRSGRDRRRVARRPRLDPAARDPRRLVSARARLPDPQLRRRRGQHRHPREQCRGPEEGRRGARPADPCPGRCAERR
jgi:hypothetical protein